MEPQNDFLDSLPKTSELLENTIYTLTNGVDVEAGMADTSLLLKWTDILKQTENTQPLGEKLSELSDALTTQSTDKPTLQRLLNDIADATTEFATGVGPEGELPPQLEGLAAALRNLAIQLS